MRKILICLSLFAICSNAFAWQSESGSGISSGDTNYSAASIEATQVLQSDTQTLLYGETRLGGVANYASHDSGGVLSMRNVSSSANKLLLNNADKLSWLTSTGSEFGIYLNGSDQFVIPGTVSTTGLVVTGTTTFVGVTATEASFGTAHVTNRLDVSGNANIVTGNYKKSTFGTNDGLLIDQTAKIYYRQNRPKRTIVLTGGGATSKNAGQSADTMGLGGTSPNFVQTTLKYSPFSDQEAQWSFVVPNSYVGTSMDANVVWYSKDLDTGNVSFDVQTVGISDNTAMDGVTFGAVGTVQDAYVASGNSMVTSTFSVPASLTSGQNAIVRLIRRSTSAGDTLSHDVNVVSLRMSYEAQTESD